LFHLIKSYIKG